LKELYIEYLKTRDANVLARFLRHWIQFKMPALSDQRISQFIHMFITHLIHVPAMFDDRYHRALQSLLDIARVELSVNTLTYTDNPDKIIKYC